MAETTHPGGTHQRRSAEEWHEIFERRAASGLPIAAFCQREGIAKSSYTRWRTLLSCTAHNAGAAPSPTGVGFVDAGVLAHRDTAEASERLALTLELGHGIVLHVVRG
ncbi:MAG: IS66 family insertion sequence element accessory protein TnpB [Propionivibrio sp.]|jgi:transposase-like protein|nr:IS66 family insertion sequence element accessory protein TnpB [Propionivibrio sp.]